MLWNEEGIPLLRFSASRFMKPLDEYCAYFIDWGLIGQSLHYTKGWLKWVGARVGDRTKEYKVINFHIENIFPLVAKHSPKFSKNECVPFQFTQVNILKVFGEPRKKVNCTLCYPLNLLDCLRNQGLLHRAFPCTPWPQAVHVFPSPPMLPWIYFMYVSLYICKPLEGRKTHFCLCILRTQHIGQHRALVNKCFLVKYTLCLLVHSAWKSISCTGKGKPW